MRGQESDHPTTPNKIASRYACDAVYAGYNLKNMSPRREFEAEFSDIRVNFAGEVKKVKEFGYHNLKTAEKTCFEYEIINI